MKTIFAKDSWNKDDFTQVTSMHTDGRIPFMQEEDCIVNDHDRGNIDNLKKYNYISLLSKETCETGDVIETECSFDTFGAPLVVISDDVQKTEDGYPVYGHHFEIVAYEEGFNVWEIHGNKTFKAAFRQYSVPEKEKITLTVKVLEDSLEVSLCGHQDTVKVERLPKTFRAGITACEGVNRFYSFEIRKG